MSRASDRVFVAYDMASYDQALAMMQRLGQTLPNAKTGHQLNLVAGVPTLGQCIHRHNGLWFLDGKLFDVLETLVKAMQVIALNLKPTFVNVCGPVGVPALKAMNEVKGDVKILVMTVPTDFDDDQCKESFGDAVRPTVTKFMRFAVESGSDGIVCSARDLEFLAEEDGFGDLIKVTPGIRPAGTAARGQKRIMTPHDAILAGADYLVIGSPITEPQAELGGPQEAAKRILDEVEQTLVERGY